MKGRIKNLITAGLLAIAPKATAELKSQLELTEVATAERPMHRVQTRLFGLPANSNAYLVWEHQDSDYHKLRLETLPVKTKNVSLGLAAQYVDGTNFEAHEEIGVSLKINGNPTENSYAQTKIRFFPEENNISTYSFFEAPKIKVDFLGSYDTHTTSTMLNPGIHYKLNETIYFGLETRISGEIDELEPVYTGIRVGAKFSK